ncbi:ketoacyl-ACP synthase III family protein [Amycolatopsis dendrobii]|uniref:Ketoacyl-ACP synthase III family protein n=1 Tax=Amycolatopsis dendrobii TaxID=2760662 RepID=A0A7W3VTN1_9PSEU|nr:ketoacyl-ACP synthase III family protein [Amycolatopsis dendrobii]MBB1152920.1 ketoacyl-ACP synthase III family protein [Amycolatopsis dendrobii]
MRFDGLYLAGLGSWLPPATTTAEAVRSGQCSAETARKSEMESVLVAPEGIAPPEMAARAARVALERSGVARGDIAVLLHATLFHQGYDLWSPAAYVQRAAVGGTCPAIEVRQVSNGGMAALDLAASYLLADPARQAALITAADRFDGPDFDRWHSDPGTAYADGGTAMVLSSVGGFARLRSLAVVGGPELEGMHRAGAAFGEVEMSTRQLVDLDAHKRSYVAEAGMSQTLAAILDGQREALKRALSDAELELSDVDRLVLPHFGRRRLVSNYLRHMDVPLERTTWDFDSKIGHLGAGDHIVSLEHLVRTGGLRPGQTCLLMGVGAGFSWSSAVIELIEKPEWAD